MNESEVSKMFVGKVEFASTKKVRETTGKQIEESRPTKNTSPEKKPIKVLSLMNEGISSTFWHLLLTGFSSPVLMTLLPRSEEEAPPFSRSWSMEAN